MPPTAGQTLRNTVAKYQKELLADWIRTQLAATTLRADLMKEGQLREQSKEFLTLVQGAMAAGDYTYSTYVVSGTLANVTALMDRLYAGGFQ